MICHVVRARLFGKQKRALGRSDFDQQRIRLGRFVNGLAGQQLATQLPGGSTVQRAFLNIAETHGELADQIKLRLVVLHGHQFLVFASR